MMPRDPHLGDPNPMTAPTRCTTTTPPCVHLPAPQAEETAISSEARRPPTGTRVQATAVCHQRKTTGGAAPSKYPGSHRGKQCPIRSFGAVPTVRAHLFRQLLQQGHHEGHVVVLAAHVFHPAPGTRRRQARPPCPPQLSPSTKDGVGRHRIGTCRPALIPAATGQICANDGYSTH